MLHVARLIPQSRGLAPVLVRQAPTVELDWDTRARSRFDAIDSSGRQLGVFLPPGQVLRGGDMLVAEDGSLVRVLAAAQPVLVIRPGGSRLGLFELTRAAYHLGNRHVSIELQPDHLKIEPDPVLHALLREMRLSVTALLAAFEPEGGAYGGHGHGHAHDHGHDDGHGHGHGPADDPAR